MSNCEITTSSDLGLVPNSSELKIHSNGGRNTQAVSGVRIRTISIDLVTEEPGECNSYQDYKTATRETEARTYSLRSLLDAGLAFQGNLPELVDFDPEFGVKFVRTRAGKDYTILTPLSAKASEQFPQD